MKVVHVITDTNIGGAGKWLLAFLDHYDRNLLDVEVIAPFNSLLKPEIEKRGVRVTEAAFLAERSFSAKAVGYLLALLRQTRPDIVHTHAAMSARVAARLTGGCKIVHTRHSVFKPRFVTTVFPVKCVFGLINGVLSDKIIAVSPAAESNLIQIGANPVKIEVIYNGVSPVAPLSADEKRRAREAFGLSPSDFVVALIARLTAVKGHGYAIGAAKIIAETSPDVKFIFAGSGDMEFALRKQIFDEGVTNVVMTGFLPDVRALENIMDAQINASYGTEATSLSLLEGMSLGAPAVVSDFGGNPYVIKDEHTGLVVPRKDAAALAAAILRLAGDPALCKRLGENAREEYESRFTAALMASRVTRTYFELTGADVSGGEKGGSL
ncbi:MAG: glycosyltransferase [Clostridiales bacterium]|jgi:glycosyltransferase involved in cell wall biosynthesis|nr:glycosyltransferase [Clostridiales bacterium]